MAEVDVIIPTFNRHSRLAGTLASLANQTYRDFRVLVVDDCSEPAVTDACIPAAAKSLNIQILRTARNAGPAGARNLAAHRATARFLAFIDDDVDAAPTWLEKLVPAVDHPERRAVFGPLLAPPDWRPTPWNDWEARTLAREYAKMTAGIYEPTWRQFFTGNAIVRREDFLAAGGFDERFTRAEDIELGIRLHRLGCTFRFEPNAAGWHYAHRSLESWLRIPREYARFDVEIDRLYPEWEWASVIDRESGERGPLVRGLRAALPTNALRRAAASSAIRASRVTHRLRLGSLAMRGLSVAYDLEYQVALQAARTVKVEQPGNPASTPPQREVPTVTR